MGDTWYQPDLAHTLELIQNNGKDGFYRGENAKRILAKARACHESVARQQHLRRINRGGRRKTRAARLQLHPRQCRRRSRAHDGIADG